MTPGFPFGFIPREYCPDRQWWHVWLLYHDNFDFALEVCQRENGCWPYCGLLYTEAGVHRLRRAWLDIRRGKPFTPAHVMWDDVNLNEEDEWVFEDLEN